MSDNASAIRVMLVDDHQTMLWGLTKLIESSLRRMQIVATASSCDEVLSSCQQANVDIILLDLDLNGESSIDILPAILQRNSARVIALTGVRDRDLLDMAVARGARGILRKDANAELVLKAIEKVHDGELWLDRETLGRVFGQMLGSPQKKPEKNDAHAALTQKELKVIGTLVQCGGLHNRELAKELFVSEHTLRNHLTSIYCKLNVANRLELYVYACKHKLGI
ncbi:response regulator transcription factor [Noviherbaspirillum sp. CPCC 100848]|uniref:Response regulator transcription factor n=1 Tax=Noviherbaspirillum album TaxID=3080276 RepID=A0ABU6JIP8_9BURK|nr:response regulator transcription factor [Noviherbaspirillum sp. CPCC 100848]MEC4723336.1 response regulator transcription factor [Noviherbaspirillum sp. CPCC 100848]